MATDEQIKKEIEEQLKWDSRIGIADINVEVDNGSVLLSGAVPSHLVRQAASEDAWVIRGVDDVNNSLILSYPATVIIPPDEGVKTNVETVIGLNPALNETKMNISVQKARVTIEGEVGVYWKLSLVEDLVWNVVGVAGLVNKLVVVPSRVFTDEEIANDIIAAINRNIAIAHSETINIKVEDGKVILSGSVPDWNAYSAAYDTVFYTSGVKDIEDKLVIG